MVIYVIYVKLYFQILKTNTYIYYVTLDIMHMLSCPRMEPLRDIFHNLYKKAHIVYISVYNLRLS